ncbi:replication initiation factor domain-containing protein [Desulfuromonas acetoxidans]|uniref:replication initiation factor domain-containing protein n=1 Tax=Desulfuromonas acetoxidans TaxID=891 RepID=UPI001594D64E|nr:replication initiation factor domain-containing protein [Desulfuromonas acetoxidans]NVD25399.1 replication initiation factor domain-containing protein [Desulfuromonas acetoxidans]NVE17500.1 replication initiation factor domain-containing protein [Desulfuromonas acetoxidans]
MANQTPDNPSYSFKRSGSTPYSDTGSLNTIAQAEISIDWLAFTFPINSKVKDSELLPQVLGLGNYPVNHCPRGLNGYSAMYEVGGAKVLYKGTLDMGIHVVLSGRCLRDHYDNPLELIQHVLLLGAKFARIDIAFDDYVGHIPISRVRETVQDGCCVGKSKKYFILQNGKLSTGDLAGQTVQVGVRTSSVIARFYDKRLERLEALSDDPEAQEKLPDIWNRCELEVKSNAAQELARQLYTIEDLRAVALGVLNEYVSFRVRNENDSNRSRWKVTEWWYKFVDLIKGIKLSRAKNESTEDSKRRWFVRQVAPSFAYLLHRFGADHMEEIYRHGLAKLRGEDESLVDALDEKRRSEQRPQTDSKPSSDPDDPGYCPF